MQLRTSEIEADLAALLSVSADPERRVVHSEGFKYMRFAILAQSCTNDCLHDIAEDVERHR